MAQFNGKREIEAICDTWQGGLESYLNWKIKRFLQNTEEDMNGIDFDISYEDILDFEGIMDLEDDVDGIFNC
jgi:hypothetical protein